MRCMCLDHSPTQTTLRQHHWLKIPLAALVFSYSALLANPPYAASMTPATHLIQTYLQKHPNLMDQQYRMQEAANQHVQQLEHLSKAEIQEVIQIRPPLQKIISIHMNRLLQRSLKHPNHNTLNTG